MGEALEGRKTRAYDFVLPYLTAGWPPLTDRALNRILIQCQFYAGDAGSVSHKNVDQTTAARQTVNTHFLDVRFIEYLDGAGYYASLNGDLRKMLEMDTTHTFFQIRSAPVRLRRELQDLGFLTPLEIEHAIVQSDAPSDVIENLHRQGYREEEIDRATAAAVENEFLTQRHDRWQLRDDRRLTVRRYLILDVLARRGYPISTGNGEAKGLVLIPGYGPFFGMGMSELVDAVIAESGSLADDLTVSRTFMSDISDLAQGGLIKLR